MIKLFYNTQPAGNLAELERGKHTAVWPANSLNENPNTFYQVLNALGIPYEWSSNPDESIVVADIGSADFHNSPEIESKIEELCNKYKKVLLFTSQEVWHIPLIKERLNTYSNLYIMDLTCYNDYNVERYLPFPALIPMIVSTEVCNTKVYTNDLDPTKEKIALYNCLMYIWRKPKHFLFSSLEYHNVLQNGVVTFRTIDIDNTHINNMKSEIESVIHNVEMPDAYKQILLENCSKQHLKQLGDYNIKDEWFDVLTRYWPIEIFNNTLFSLVCECENGYENTVPSISEKYLYPVLNGHPVLTFGQPNFNKNLERLGFALHDEMFDFSFDSIEEDPVRALKMVEQLKDKTVADYNPDREKIMHNQHLINNRGSSLWCFLKETMHRYLEILQ